MTPLERGRQGLARMDEVIARRPHKDGEALTAATAALCAYRSGLIARATDGGAEARLRLERLNAVLSVVAGLHFPLGSAPWDAFAAAREALAGLLREEERTAA